MGYVFLMSALLMGATKGYCGKKTSGSMQSYSDAMLINTLRMFLCIIIGSVFVLAGDKSFSAFQLSPYLFFICAISGISTSFFVVTWIVSVKRSAYMMLDVFLTLAVIVPLILCNILFDEAIKPLQWLGFIMLIIAAYIMCSYNNSIKEKITMRSFLLMLVCGLSNGVSSFAQKWFTYKSVRASAAVFNFYTYVISAIILLTCFIIVSRNENKSNLLSPLKHIYGYVIVMAVCLFLNSFFMTKSAEYLDSVKTYPLSQGGALILSTLMSVIFFKEKITVKCVIGLVITFASLLIINLT